MVAVTVVVETDGPPVRGGREALPPGVVPTASARLAASAPSAPSARPAASRRLRLRVVRTTARAVSWYARRDLRPAPAASRRNPDMPKTTAGTAS
nr:hypothetical protein OG409_21545 [Streptomyces sp. NBC_00974]